MKKLLIIAVAFVATVMVACDNHESPPQEVLQVEQHEKKAKIELLEELKNYNANYFADGSTTRGFGGWLRRLLKTAYIDAVGGVFGSLLGPWGTLGGAAMASCLAYTTDAPFVPAPYPPTLARKFQLDHPYPVDDEVGVCEDFLDGILEHTVLPTNLTIYADSVGHHHNKIIMRLQLTHLLDSAALNTGTMFGSICSQADNMPGYSKGSYTNEQLLQGLKFNQLKNLLESYTGEESFETFVADMIELYPEYEYELDFISDYISSLCSIPQFENDGSYATGVLHLISMSGVSVDMKKRLGNAVIAGNASARLWNFN